MAQVGFEPTASQVLSQGGRPVAYRAVTNVEFGVRNEERSDIHSAFRIPHSAFESAQSRIRTCKHSGLSRVALPIGLPGRLQVVPDGIEPSFPGCEPSVVAVGPRDCVTSH